MRPYRLCNGVAAIVLSVQLTTIISGCASSRGSYSYSSEPTNSSAAPSAADEAASTAQAQNSEQRSQTESGFAGVWQGSTLANCSMSLPDRCNAQQNVTITLLEGPDSKLTGTYQCSYGNMDCYHMNQTGKVSYVSLNGARMNIRVLMPDGTSCIFTGYNANQAVNGGYSCYAGGPRIEQGSWRARRSY